MTGFLLRVAAVERLSLHLTDEYNRLTQVNHKALVARATVAAARLRRRRASTVRSSPSTPFKKRRFALQGHNYRSTDIFLLLPVQKLLQRRLDMASQQEIRRRSSAADKTAPVEPLSAPENVATTTTFANPPDVSNTHERKHRSTASLSAASIMEDLAKYNNDNETMPPPSRPMSQEFNTPTRGSRSASVVSRHSNRLSISLPVAPPTPDASRPTPTSAVLSPIPADPIENPVTDAPSNAGEFIIAIAAQERRVLELKEELARAESDLTSLKKQWASQDVAVHRKTDSRTFGPRLPVAVPEPERLPSRNSMDLDRKKLFMQNQSAPTSGRRRVLRGGHTRTLSLLSPPKSTSSFAVLEDEHKGVGRFGPLERRNTTKADPQLSKRTSWQPRLAQNTPGMPALVEDFKSGLRAFVEDIRQITVGDEPIKGPLQNPTPSQQSMGQELASQPMCDMDTIRPPPPAARANVSTVFGSPSAALPSPTASSKTRDLTKDKIKSGKGKYFSWTPLGLDALGDNDWSNWESPASTKSVRWSGSTISNGEDEIAKAEDRTTPSKRPMSLIEGPLLSPKLEEILPNVVNRFSPSNLKRTATNLMDEWERSLTAPESADKENATQ